jgi:hypothetical protein
MYKLTLKEGSVMKVKTPSITITLEAGKEYHQSLLKRLHEDGVKCIAKAKESAKTE